MTSDDARTLAEGDVRARLGEIGVALGSDVDAPILAAAQRYRAEADTLRLAMTVLVLALALGGGGLAWRRTTADYRARNAVETAVLALLIGAAMIAIMTTVGIVLSLIFNTVHFFRLYPRHRLLLRPDLEPVVWRRLAPRHPAASVGHALHLGDRAGGGGADRPLRRGLPV